MLMHGSNYFDDDSQDYQILLNHSKKSSKESDRAISGAELLEYAEEIQRPSKKPQSSMPINIISNLCQQKNMEMVEEETDED